MLIDLNYLCNKYNFTPKGVIHVGAHIGEEAKTYNNLGAKNVIWVEANPIIYEKLVLNTQQYPGHKCFNYLTTDVDDKEYFFYVTNNGESSSILELDKHKIHHPHIFVSDTMELSSKKLDSILYDNKLNINDYNLLNLDVQGAELLVLKGFREGLNSIKYIYTEINVASIYKDCAQLTSLDLFLSNFNFERVETKITEYEWGDALYIKK